MAGYGIRSLYAFFGSVVLLAVLQGTTFAADPTTFAILTAQQGKVPEVHPNDEFRLRLIDGDATLEPDKVQLLIEGSRVNIVPTIMGNEIVFRLTRNEQNRPFWVRILGATLDKRKTVSIGLEINGKALKYRGLPVNTDESPQSKAEFVPAEPISFAIVKQAKQVGNVPEVKLKGTLKARVDGDTPIDVSKVQLRLAGELLNVAPRLFFDNRELEFPLVRNDKNRALWSRLLGSPFSSDEREEPVSLELDGKPLKYSDSRKQDEVGEAKIKVIAYNGLLMTVGLLGVAAVIVISFLFAAKTTLIKDSLIPQMRRSDRSYSLGRLQMLVWFCLIFSSFVFIFVVTFDLNSITTESFALLGISATTALAAVAVDRSKTDEKDPLQIARKEIETMGIKTSEQVELLFNAKEKDATQKAKLIIPEATLTGKTDPTVDELWTAYEASVKRFRSSGLLQDLVNDIKGPTIHRWQIVIWTIVLGAIYFGLVYSNLETPSFGANLLALMGISGGVYLGFKIPEKST
jgi:hypothetical protein